MTHQWTDGAVCFEATCDRCGEIFNPDGPADLVHVADVNGHPCGGTAIDSTIGAWGVDDDTLGPCGCVDYHVADCPTRTGYADALSRAEYDQDDFYRDQA